MKTIAAAFLTIFLLLTVSAQQKMTDSEFEGFKGSVKSVSIETMPLSDQRLRNKRSVWEKWTYDTSGRKIEEYNPQGKSKMVFTHTGGVKTSKLIELEGENSGTLNLKYTYEYDANGRVKTEREDQLGDGLTTVRTFKYDEKGRLIEKTDNGPASLTKIVYKYDANGNLIEQNYDSKGKGEYGSVSKSRTVYIGYKLDAAGNWTERKSTVFYEGADKPYVSMDYQVFTYH
ncbi:MAG: hypothetical protein R2681_06480 [Pyrinomonadaceae bacterium]